MTLAAPRSRQGRLTLALVIFAAVAATVGALFWASQASALPNTTVTWSSAPASGAVNPGQVLSYDPHFTLVGGGSTGSITFTADLPDNLTSITDYGSSVGGGACANGAGNVYACTQAAGVAAGTYWIHVSGVVPASGSVGSAGASVCDTATCEPASGSVSSATTQTINGVSCTGAGNFLGGSNQTVSCLVPAGLTYCSDVTNDGLRTFVVGDMPVVLAGGATIVTAQAAGLAATSASDTATVTVTGPVGGSASVTLSTHLATSTSGADCTATPAQVVTFAGLVSVAGGAGGVLRHVDVDCASERASDAGDNHNNPGPPNTGGDYGSNVLACNGLLSNGNVFTGVNAVSGYALDDPDDAVGSSHTVCILSGALGAPTGDAAALAAMNANLSWTVTPTAAHQDPVDVNTNKHGLDVSGNSNVEPCVSWRVGDVGVEQDITAIYTPTGETIYSNGVRNQTPGVNFGLCPGDTSDGTIYSVCQPLIKEWNSIIATKIVQASGAVSPPTDTIFDNTGDLENWSGRDGNDCSPASSAFCARANLDGETITVSGSQFNDATLLATGRSFIDYTLGSHSNYDGPVDGAEQTFTISGTCGTVVVENPLTGATVLLDTDPLTLGILNSVTLLSNSDKGVGFTVSPANDGSLTTQFGNAFCFDGDSTTVTISTRESTAFLSNDPFIAANETITVNWIAGPGAEKQPMLAWVGQRVVLEHDWSDPDGTCLWYPNVEESFFVRYLIQAPSPGALSNVPGAPPAVVTGPDYIIVEVTQADDCISRVIYESQNQGRVDVTAHVVEDFGGQPASDFTVISPEYDFWYYYMKIEDVTLKIVPGARAEHNAGAFAPQNPSAVSDVDTVTSNVSADELLRVTVRGWVLADNCPVKDAGEDINGLLLPANRCTFPDDWAQVLGDDEQFDILGAAPSSCTNVAGPFSLLQEVRVNGSSALVNCGDTLAPHVNGGFRESVFSNGTVDKADAPFPPALITLNLEGSGFLHGADKADVYSASNQYFDTHIPAEPGIITGFSGYQWHTWSGGIYAPPGGTGERAGLYHFWTSLAGTGNAIESCPGDSPCSDGVATGGFDMIQIYSDNHGEAMAWVNGDANLDFTDCDNNLASHAIVLLSGHYCENNDVVGTTTVTANADYPDKKPHRDVDADDDVTITWTWGGTKDISVVDDAADSTGQFNYVVFRVTDRDGGCTSNNSLHPVLGENVHFQIDSPAGIIFDDVNGNNAEFGPGVPNGSKSADVTTFDANNYYALNDLTQPADLRISFAPTTDECEAWIHVSESQLANVNVIVTAFDPEGTVTFDTKAINPPTPVPPTPTPFTINTKWGNTDCSADGIKARDVQALQKFILELPLLTVFTPCPSIGQTVIVAGNTHQWGNWDCSAGGGIQARDGQALQVFILERTPALSQTSPCPAVNADVAVQPVSIP